MFVKFSRAVVLGIVCIMLASFTEVLSAVCYNFLSTLFALCSVSRYSTSLSWQSSLFLRHAWNIHYCKLSDLCLPREWRYALRRDYMCSLASSHHGHLCPQPYRVVTFHK
ncbi:hypothetical protein C8R45DRAFT_1033639 [Mycena sanguinolenta]|nr:hypothetical protein C8R45DRAFT_1033639 [Mycena sanguinolenta]